MCRSTKSVRLIIAASLIVFIARNPAFVKGLEENEEIVDDFANGTANYWQVGYSEDNSSTMWYLATHGDPHPFGFDSVRPPMEENGGGFIEVVPYSDAPAQIFSEVFDLLPGATAELTYWNIVPFPVLARTTVLILYTEFVDVLEESVDAPPKSVQVFTAPLPTDPSPGWTTVIIDLKINQPSNVQLRLDGNRANLSGTGLAISRIAINNGKERSTTTTSTTMESTLSDVTPSTAPSTAEAQTETISITNTTRKDTSFPNPTKFDVEKSTTQIPTTTTTSSPTTVTTSSPNTTAPSTPVISTTTISPTTMATTMTMSSTSITDSSPTFPPLSTSTLSISSETTASYSETTYSSSITSQEVTSSPKTVFTTVSPSSSSSTTSTGADSTTSQYSSADSASPTNSSASSTESTTFTPFTSTSMSSSSAITTVTSSHANSPSSIYTPTTAPLPTTPRPGMTSQLRGIAIGVSVSIILLVLSCLLFGFLYRRHRRRVYLIEKSQLEAGTIRQLEQLDEIPSVSRRTDSDCCSTSSTTASDAPLVPTRNG